MNQQCKVCGEPAAGFHFGAFTCEGCKSFFGRSYNNLGSITECKNNGECVINKKNRTACKACRLRKCLLVGMSKSGSRYGRRSNWFKIHCLLQEQQQQQQQAAQGGKNAPTSPLLFPHHMNGFLHPDTAPSPSISSPDSDSSDSPRMKYPPPNPFLSKDFYLSLPFPSFPLMQPPPIPSPFLLPPTLFPFSYAPKALDERGSPSPPRQLPYASPPINNNYETKNNNNNNNNNNVPEEKTSRSKRFYLDAILGLNSDGSQKQSSPKPTEDRTQVQSDPMDLSVKKVTPCCERQVEPSQGLSEHKLTEDVKPLPLDLSV